MPSDKFLTELKAQYQKEFELKNELDQKANNVTTTSATIIGFLLAFATFLLTGFSEDFAYLLYVKILLIVSIAGSVSAILLSALSFQLLDYRYVMGGGKMYSDDKQVRDAQIERYKKMNDEEFDNQMLTDYAKALRLNAENNAKKGLFILVAQWSFFVCIVLIVSLIFLVVYAVSIGQFSFNLPKIGVS